MEKKLKRVQPGMNRKAFFVRAECLFSGAYVVQSLSHKESPEKARSSGTIMGSGILRIFYGLVSKIRKNLRDRMRNSYEERVFRTASRYMDKIIWGLKTTLPDAKLEAFSNYAGGYRFPEEAQNSRLIIVLKLVQMASNLRAAKLLLSCGYVYEFMVIQRVIFDAFQDISILLDEPIDLCKDLKREFYRENVDFEEFYDKYFVLRKRKLKYILSQQKETLDADGIKKLGKDVDRDYDRCSGYVHGRYVSIMDMYTPDRFCTSGLCSDDIFVRQLKVSAYKFFWIVTQIVIASFWGVCKEWNTDKREISEGDSILSDLGKITNITRDPQGTWTPKND